MKTIAVVNGPNLNRLGTREPEVYGSETLEDLESRLTEEASKLGVTVQFHQSNHEGTLVDLFGQLSDEAVAGVILNGAAYTHTSVALRDAISASGLRVIEVHISNIYSREEFRKHSYTAAVAEGVITGLGFNGYSYALQQLAV
ncbi:MAG: type II 3-dehydroquinate dehydratase [Verrucomicrobia bacterium]|nr:type II 3-dehydroquinate dehydratase [Verrucomicrobiota bacterium]